MNKDETIKEMAEILNKNCGNCSICEFAGKSTAMLDCTELCYATALYNAGYRKVADDEMVIKKSEYEELQECDELNARLFTKNCILECSNKKLHFGVFKQKTKKRA